MRLNCNWQPLYFSLSSLGSLPLLEELSLNGFFFDQSLEKDTIAKCCPGLKKLVLRNWRGLLRVELDCPSLVALELIEFPAVDLISVQGMNLRSLIIKCKRRDGRRKDLNVEFRLIAPKLESIYWKYVAPVMHKLICEVSLLLKSTQFGLIDGFGSPQYSTSLLKRLLNTHTLVLNSICMGVMNSLLRNGNIRSNQAWESKNIKCMKLKTNLHPLQFDAIFHMIKCAPNLHSLTIVCKPHFPTYDVRSEVVKDFHNRGGPGHGGYWERNSNLLSLKKLSILNIQFFKGTKYSMDFLKFLFKFAKSLSRVSIRMSKKKVPEEIRKRYEGMIQQESSNCNVFLY